MSPQLLWFAFKFVPLNHWKQPTVMEHNAASCCDLLSNLYLWTIGNSRKWGNTLWALSCDLLSNLYLWTIGNSFHFRTDSAWPVVICFQICTFEPLETAKEEQLWERILLWFAFKFVPLNHWKQRVYCHAGLALVVICFQICTFEPLETAGIFSKNHSLTLWFAFKFVPLNHWKQLVLSLGNGFICCDLLSNLYLWTIGNSHLVYCSAFPLVVICFQICTFEPLETALDDDENVAM